MGAFAAMGVMDASINLVSLFAFIVVLGILVDDAIVVGESVYTLGSKGEKSLQASIKGTHLVAMPVTFAIITSMVAFVPMLFLPGWLGKFLFESALTPVGYTGSLGPRACECGRRPSLKIHRQRRHSAAHVQM